MSNGSFKVALWRSGVPLSVVDLTSASVLLGSGAHCDIRVDPELAAAEHLRLEYQAGLASFVVLSPQPLTKKGDAIAVSGELLNGEFLTIGELRVQVQLPAATAAPKESKLTIVRFAIACLVAAVALVFGGGLEQRIGSDGTRRPPQPSQLFSKPEKTACPETAAVAAQWAGRNARREADGRRERAPFNPQEGLRAIRAYRQAAHCFELAGMTVEAKENFEVARSLQVQVEKTFHVHSVRLERALATTDTAQARNELQILASYLQERNDDYKRWIDATARRLALQK